MKKFIILTLIIITNILFFSCDMESMEGIGTLVIRLPGESGYARTLTQTEKDKYLSELKYSIECSGPVSMIKRDAGAGETVPLYLTSGRYNITVTITNKNGRVIGSETKTETIEAGEKKSVDFKIDLDEPIYFKASVDTNDENVEQYKWAIDRHDINLGKYYTKKLINNNTYIINIKGHSNKDIQDIDAHLWLYTGDDLINRADVNMYMYRLGKISEESKINFEENRDFDITFEVMTADFSLTPAASNYLNDPGRISISFDKKVEELFENGTIMAAITHFNMTVKETLSFDMVVWSRTTNSGWSSGHDRNSPIYVVPEYLPSIKSNTTYKITAKGHSSAEMERVEGQFQLGIGIGATIYDNGATSQIASIKGDFEVVFYVTTNNEITNRNQGNVIFNLTSNYQEYPSDEEDTVKATITRFSMEIEEVISGSNSVDWNSSSNYSIRISNNSSTDLIAFKDSINENNILGGIQAKSVNHGIKKDLFPPNPAQIKVLFITKEQYEANAGNFSGLQNMIFTQIVVYWNGNDGDNCRVYNLSDKLGGDNRLQIINSSNYDVEFRVGSIAGHTLFYAPQGQLMANIFTGVGEYLIYPVFQRYNQDRDIIETVILTYSSGIPYRYEVNFAPGYVSQTLNLNLQDAISSPAIQQSPGIVSVAINNAGAAGVKFYKGDFLMKTPGGKQIINSGEFREFIFDMPITGNSFSESLTVGNFYIESSIGKVQLKDQNGNSTFTLMPGKRYTITVTGGTDNVSFSIDTSNPDDLEFDPVSIKLLN